MVVESDPRFIRLDERIKSLQERLNDMEWKGEKDTAKLHNLKGSLAYCQSLLKSGRTYLPLF
jgi:hypothetical protein